MLTISQAAFEDLTAKIWFGIARLRQDIFIIEQDCPYPDLDEYDIAPDTIHFWVKAEDGAEDGADIVATLRLLRKDNEWKIGRVCTAKSHRGTGLSAALMQAAVDKTGDAVSVLEAQSYATGFYAKFGYVIEGEEFLEDGIPHRYMRRSPKTL